MNYIGDKEISTYQAKTDAYIKTLLRPHLEKNKNINLKSLYKSIYFEINQDRNLIVHLPHKLFAQWFDHHIRKQLEECIHSHLAHIDTINYQVKKNRDKKLSDYEYDPQFNFQNFLYNSNNYLSYMSLYEFAHNSSTSLKSALVTGEKGSGKTHLLKAIANYYLENHPDKKILYLSYEQLHSLSNRNYQKNLDIKSWLYTYDIVLLDDLQQLDIYPEIQKELISIFDYFLEHEKRLIFACRGNTRDLEMLKSQFKSRLESGLITRLKPPDLDIRIRYLQEQDKSKNLGLNQNQILNLAGSRDNFKSLLAVVVKVLAHKELKSRTLDENTLQEIIAQQSDKGQNNFQDLMTVICNYFGYSFEEIKSKKRQQKLVMARQVAMFLCREILGYSYLKIGSLFGDRDHSTVMHSIKKIMQLQEVDADMNFMLKVLKITCYQAIS